MSFWDLPEAQEALAARHMDRLVLNAERPAADASDAALSVALCYQCGSLRPSSELVGIRDARNHASHLCSTCHAVNEKRYRDEYGDEPLAAWQAEDR